MGYIWDVDEARISPSPAPFELSGGRLCLDFANTWSDRDRPDTDLLGSYDALLGFAWQAGVLFPEAWLQLTARSGEDPASGAEILRVAKDVREAVYGLFSGCAQGRPVAAGDLAPLNAALQATLPHRRIAAAGERLEWGWTDPGASLLSPLWPIVLSAAELLTSADLPQVRQCDGARCTWLFMDQSRSRSRRWCSMASCGNRAKARRHYQRRGPT